MVAGPTASGKSDLGIFIAQKLSGEIISADSRQVYRGMDLGTGKVNRDRITKNESRVTRNRKPYFVHRNSYFSNGVCHHLLDVASPKQDFSVARYVQLARKALADIQKRGKVPIIAGGTGFYIDALLGRTSFAPVKPDKKLRAELEKQSAEELYDKLLAIDDRRAKDIDPHNKRRLIRALEIIATTGKPVPKLELRSTNYDILWIGIYPGKKKLVKNIQKRLDARLKKGMIREVVRLHEQGVSWKRLENFGLEYRWMSRYLRGLVSKEELKNGLAKAIVQYAKRQMTWFKRNKEIQWVTSQSQALRLAKPFLA